MAEEDLTTLTAQLKAAAAAFPSRRAVAVPGKADLTHAALDALVDAAAARLAARAGVRLGHTVALCFPNTVEVKSDRSDPMDLCFVLMIDLKCVAFDFNVLNPD